VGVHLDALAREASPARIIITGVS
jgi:hypothetical protein